MRLPVSTLILCLLLAAPAARALDSDRQQPATIEADEVEFDFRTGKRVYKGDVVVVQGTLRITGDKLVIEYTEQGDQIEKATSWGTPATFKQRPEGKDSDVYGEGDEIVLNEIENTLTLIENAVMTQAGNTAKGQRIVYDMASDRMTVKGMERQQQPAADAGDTETESGRARVIITPEEQQSATQGTGEDATQNTGEEATQDTGEGTDQDRE